MNSFVQLDIAMNALILIFLVVIIVGKASCENHANEEVPDYSEIPDVVFLVQRAGMSDEDFNFVRKFVSRGIQALKKFGSGEGKSRVGVTVSGKLPVHHVEFHSCCSGSKTDLLLFVDGKMTLYNETVVKNIYRGTYSDISPHFIDVKSGIKSIREKYFSDGSAKTKPTIVFTILNFQSPYMSFRLMNEAVTEIRAATEAGAYFSVIIIDREVNRQPRLSSFSNSEYPQRKYQNQKSTVNSQGKKRLFELLGTYVQKRTETPQSENYILGMVERLSKMNYNDLHILSEIERLGQRAPIVYSDLTLLYAQVRSPITSYLSPILFMYLAHIISFDCSHPMALSGRNKHGFKLQNYGELISARLLNLLVELLENPLSWFGDGTVVENCPETKNGIEKTIWSPGFKTVNEYENKVRCQWVISVKPGMHVVLTFETIDIEETFDKIIIYDGHERDESQIKAIYSGHLTKDGPVVTNSTEERMLISFETDGGHTGRGFLARWSTEVACHHIDDATVVYLVDVSASLDSNNYTQLSTFIKLSAKYLEMEDPLISDDPFDQFNDYKRMGNFVRLKPSTPSKFGLVQFDETPRIVSDVTKYKTRQDFFKATESLNKTLGATYIGKALDFTRMQQFYTLLGEQSYFPKPPQVIEAWKKIPRRLLFIFSDGHSVDDPRPAARRLCEWDIIPILIELGDLNVKAKKELTSFCGLSFSIKTPVPEIMKTIIVHLNMSKESLIEPTELPSLPSKPPLPTRTTTTTTTTRATKPAVYTGTYPTFPPTTRKPPVPDNFNYDGIAILLAVLGFIETIALFVAMSYNASGPTPFFKLPVETQSLELAQRRLQKLLKEQSSELDEENNEEEYEDDRDILRHVTSLKMKRSRYPNVANSFFTKKMFVPDTSKLPDKNMDL